VVNAVKVAAANVAIGPQAAVLMVTVPVAIAARAVTVPVVDAHSKWRPRLNLKN